MKNELIGADMEKKDAGYQMAVDEEPWITIVTYDSAGRATGCLPINLYLYEMGNHINCGLYEGPDGKKTLYVSSRRSSNGVKDYTLTYTLEPGYQINSTYYLAMQFYELNQEKPEAVTEAQPDGTQAEQVLWEKVNSAWYAFGVNGYLKSGWIYDYQLGGWYYTSIETGMGYGWYTDPQDGYTYYLDTVLGKLAVGWKQIDGKWFYFNESVPSPTWLYDEAKGVWFFDGSNKNKPFGSLYRSEQTPDGYYVGADGAWDERK